MNDSGYILIKQLTNTISAMHLLTLRLNSSNSGQELRQCTQTLDLPS